MKPLIVALALCAAGCASPEQRIIAHCNALGEGPGTAYYPYCAQSEQEMRQRRAEMFSHMAISGAAMLQPAPTVYVVRPYW